MTARERVRHGWGLARAPYYRPRVLGFVLLAVLGLALAGVVLWPLATMRPLLFAATAPALGLALAVGLYPGLLPFLPFACEAERHRQRVLYGFGPPVEAAARALLEHDALDLANALSDGVASPESIGRETWGALLNDPSRSVREAALTHLREAHADG